MILFLDTSGSTCHVYLHESSTFMHYQWQADRNLAHGLLKFLQDCLAKNHASWDDLTGLAFMAGPGSFTGLRIGATVLNTIADAQNIPIVGFSGKNWRTAAKNALKAGKNQQLVLPEYGGRPNITTPKK
ncbi:tRNA (adenosine(37)-N6)-threonylcarbamoyltransferase complex dimerization subunit type 1 TsaB [Candidatus Saccharibacteria bacterium]|nr:tRNA (adenosine(37)-N6)-threonylcarbamoyltransferase complex dimerization subunit type 1 TsaB [Candidatus Saccharibacteria bacterium]